MLCKFGVVWPTPLRELDLTKLASVECSGKLDSFINNSVAGCRNLLKFGMQMRCGYADASECRKSTSDQIPDVDNPQIIAHNL